MRNVICLLLASFIISCQDPISSDNIDATNAAKYIQLNGYLIEISVLLRSWCEKGLIFNPLSNRALQGEQKEAICSYVGKIFGLSQKQLESVWNGKKPSLFDEEKLERLMRWVLRNPSVRQELEQAQRETRRLDILAFFGARYGDEVQRVERELYSERAIQRFLRRIPKAVHQYLPAFIVNYTIREK